MKNDSFCSVDGVTLPLPHPATYSRFPPPPPHAVSKYSPCTCTLYLSERKKDKDKGQKQDGKSQEKRLEREEFLLIDGSFFPRTVKISMGWMGWMDPSFLWTVPGPSPTVEIK